MRVQPAVFSHALCVCLAAALTTTACASHAKQTDSDVGGNLDKIVLYHPGPPGITRFTFDFICGDHPGEGPQVRIDGSHVREREQGSSRIESIVIDGKPVSREGLTTINAAFGPQAFLVRPWITCDRDKIDLKLGYRNDMQEQWASFLIDGRTRTVHAQEP